MKKIIVVLIAVFTVLTFTSCETYAQTVVDDNGIVYEYSYNDYPVRYIDGVAYYYFLVDNIWRWTVLPHAYYPYIIHHHRPLVYHRPVNYYHHYYSHRPSVSRYQVYNRPSIRYRTGNIHNRNMTGRPSNYGGSTVHRGGSIGINRGNFGNSSSRGRR